MRTNCTIWLNCAVRDERLHFWELMAIPPSAMAIYDTLMPISCMERFKAVIRLSAHDDSLLRRDRGLRLRFLLHIVVGFFVVAFERRRVVGSRAVKFSVFAEAGWV